MDTMGRKEPQLIIIDQDPAIRNAVPTVFKTARHRFCMWHIMNKVADKIDIITRKETDFLLRLNRVVWNQDLEPTEFEDKWNELFERRGLICRNIFWVFSNKLLKTIPEKYILTRWSKNALRGPIYDLDGNIIENYDTADESQLEMSKVWSEFYNVISVVAKKEADVLRDLQRVLRGFKDTVEPTNEKMSKRQEMEMLIGCSAPDEVRILPPRHLKNKGSGKRIVTSKNKTIEKAKKPKRRCDNCKRMAYHDSRNCQEPFTKHPPKEEESSDSERVD
ncbi:hypothetical protein RND81_08G128700 [Saponaria officinalis]|uniref:MULE transposase domain-containing protein n=1 Tax=Saponaria officinalis TaxID=3572 RepID=A0AAW1J7K8_SAPOF